MSLDRPAAARPLLRRAAPPAPDGTNVDVTVDSAGWEFADIAVYRLRPGQSVARDADDRERLVARARGPRRRTAGDHDFGILGTRDDGVRRAAAAVVLVAPGPAGRPSPRPTRSSSSPRRPGGPVRADRLIAAGDVLVEARGAGQTARRIHHLLPPDAEAGGSSCTRCSRPAATGRASRRTSTTPRTRRSSPGSRSSTSTGSRGRRASRSSASTPRTAPSTRRWRPATATSCWCRVATTRWACRRATTATTSTSWPVRPAPGTSRSIPTTRGSWTGTRGHRWRHRRRRRDDAHRGRQPAPADGGDDADRLLERLVRDRRARLRRRSRRRRARPRTPSSWARS